jgi:drug/metabolite transporter (DMT)-like permease
VTTANPTPTLRNFVELNLAVLFLSTSGVLGRFIPLPAEMAVWWRALLGGILLALFCWYKGYSFRIAKGRPLVITLVSGVLMAAHWVLYFYALKLSTVAIAMLAVFTYPAMTTLLEPLLLRKSFEIRHLLLALLVLVGVYLLAPELNLSSDVTAGLICGLASALMYALRNVLLKTQLNAVSGAVLMFYQMVIVLVVVSPALAFFPFVPPAEAIPYLILLGLITTAIGQTMFLMSFRHFSVTTASILGCINPVFGISFAAIIFNEFPPLMSLLGGAFILLAVVIEALWLKRV